MTRLSLLWIKQAPRIGNFSDSNFEARRLTHIVTRPGCDILASENRAGVHTALFGEAQCQVLAARAGTS
jgi:hypothetical protein